MEIDSLLLREIVQHSFDEIFITDNNGTVLHVSPFCYDLYGVEAQKIIGQTVEELEQQNVLNPSVSKLVLASKVAESRIQFTKLNKKVIVSAYPTFDEAGELERVLSFSRDITELEMLKEKNEQVARTVALHEKELERLRRQKGILQDESKMQKLMELISKVSYLDVTILLEGESGVGKTRLAQLVHKESFRKDEPYIEVNCGAIPEALIESELFGYEEGAFTGARKGGKKGYFEIAQKGTILLDEIAELPLHLQVKLLSVLQNRKITRIGGNKEIKIDCRVICATNKNLEQLVKLGDFREDLYFRINVIKIEVPPLRERKTEIILLIDEFTKEFNKKYHLNKSFSTEMITWMTHQYWPGNVRELRNYIEKTMILSNGEKICFASLDPDFTINLEDELTLGEYMEAMEREFIIRKYEKYPNSIALGKALKISQATANRKINKYIRSSTAILNK
ncbi:sigma-54 interaction domain-containing protein [Bacillus sp. FJAT-29790]|uniref:sigma-54 interaction domain-containing protein n=1 Tax=Bacillus sp. FJAT-29790 TaxID=1895002 RepID=UPI00349F90C9